MILRVDPDAALPVYEQIRTQIATMIASGALAPGTQLPTIRQLAADLGLAKGTVSKAYEELVNDGAIVSRGRQGTVVNGPPARLGAREVTRRLEEASERFALEIRQLGADADTAHRHLARALARLPGPRP
jgi:GntR family transcriptional regulator